MKRMALLGFSIVAVLSWVVFSLVGCGSKCEEIRKNRKVTQLDKSQAGSVQGTVTFKGTPPNRRKLSAAGPTPCAKHLEGAYDENVLVNSQGRIQNVFVYIKFGLENIVFPIPETAVVIDQKKCMFAPRVVGVQICQDIKLVNSDDVEHNVNSGIWNISLLGGGSKVVHIHESKIMAKLICNHHGWMEGYVGVLDHPCFSVSDENGQFKIESVPVGKYTVAAWHEEFGQQAKEIELKPQEKVELSFVFGSK